MQARVLHPDVIDYVFIEFEERLAQTVSQQGWEMLSIPRHIEEPERQIWNCTEAIASIGLSSFLRLQLIELETQHRHLTERLLSLAPQAVRLQLSGH